MFKNKMLDPIYLPYFFHDKNREDTLVLGWPYIKKAK